LERDGGAARGHGYDPAPMTANAADGRSPNHAPSNDAADGQAEGSAKGRTAALRRVERLARLALEPAREERLAADLERVLAAFESLTAVDVRGLEPLHQPNDGRGSERDTRRVAPEPPLDREALLARAPRTRDGFFSVPKTIAE
jgi:aspartyl/glutamyl-tRNA(Asn/Gln) amidotransferase C subunit